LYFFVIFGFIFYNFSDIKPRIRAFFKHVTFHFRTALNSMLNNFVASLKKVQKYVENIFRSVFLFYPRDLLLFLKLVTHYEPGET